MSSRKVPEDIQIFARLWFEHKRNAWAYPVLSVDVLIVIS